MENGIGFLNHILRRGDLNPGLVNCPFSRAIGRSTGFDFEWRSCSVGILLDVKRTTRREVILSIFDGKEKNPSTPRLFLELKIRSGRIIMLLYSSQGSSTRSQIGSDLKSKSGKRWALDALDLYDGQIGKNMGIGCSQIGSVRRPIS